MKNRKRVAAAAVLLLFAVVAVFWSLKRSEPPAEKPVVATAKAPAPAPAPPPPPVATEEPASGPAETAAAAEPQSKPSSGGKVVRASSRKAVRENTESDEPKPEEEATNKATAQFQPEPTPAATTPPPPTPAPKPEPEPSVGVSGLFQNRVGASFTLVRVTVTLDGRRVYSGAGGKSLEVFRTTVPPGSHNVSVQAEYRANSAGGVFSYAEGYRFGVQGGRRFTTTEGRPLRITMTGFERGGPTTAFDERLVMAVTAR